MAGQARIQFEGAFDNFYWGNKTVDLASIANGAQTTTTITIAGLAVGDVPLAVWSNATMALLQMEAYANAANTATIIFANTSGGAIDLPSQTFYVLFGRPNQYIKT